MFVPYNVDVPMERVPIANWFLVGVTTFVSLAILFGGSVSLVEMLVLQRERGFSSPLQLPGYLLVHAGFLHLLGNMIFLFCFGNAVNAKMGHLAYVVFYFAVGILAGVAWLVAGDGLYLVGASGAIMGVVGVFLVLFPRNNVSVFYWFWFTGTFQMPSGMLIALYVAFDVWGLVASAQTSVAYISHVVGMLAGVAVAVVLLRIGMIASTRYEQNLLQVLKIQD